MTAANIEAIARLDSWGITSYFPFSVEKKKPIVEWTLFRSRKPSETAKEKWRNSKEDYIFGIVCDGQITALDIDNEEIYLKFFSDIETLTIKTPNRGRHLIFQETGEKLAQKWRGWDIDILGLGGNCKVLGPGYSIEKDLPIAKIRGDEK